MKKLRMLSCLSAAALCLGLAAGCSSPAPSGGQQPAGTDVPASIKIGVVNPTTGPLAGFGEGTPWTENLIIDAINAEGGIYFEKYDASLPIELIVYDSQSSTTTASEMAQKLVEEDHVDLLLARHTPDTVIPVVTVAERYGVPCIGTDAPVDVWLAECTHDYTYHAHWLLSDLYKIYVSMWQKMGYGPGSKVGFLFPTDADGNMFRDYFLAHLPEDGYTDIVDPGQYPQGTSDYSDVINKFKAENVEILFGVNTTPDFGAFLLQAKQLGFEPKVMSMAKAMLMEADVLSMGTDLADNCITEVWWSVDRTFVSDLTGTTNTALDELYRAETNGRPFTPSMASKYEGMEIAVDVLQRAASLEPEDILAAAAATDIETICGHISYNDEHYCPVVLTGGQWQLQEDGNITQVIFDNSLAPELPTTGSVRPYHN